ncbi:hypothetical protein V1264_024934 [Littorina saxatilis]|uniref:Uncharacterized protein n=2 Tax=Littorina saxatilis TaxID=31220 RepID=A0AAN9FYE8_9CAEN
MTQSTVDSPANEATGVPVAVIAGVGAVVAFVIAVSIVVFVVIRKKRGKPPHPGHPAVSNTENRGHRMANVTDNRNTTDGVTPAAEHHRTGDRDPTSTTENVYEITEENGHYYEPLSHRDNTYINDDTLYSNPVFTNGEEGGGRSEVNSVSGGDTTYYNTGVQTKVNCNDNTTYHNMG